MHFDERLFPSWLYPGALAIPAGGTRRKATKRIDIMAPLEDDEDKTLYFGTLAEPIGADPR